MEIEARLGIRVDGTAKIQPPPTAAPTDGPADLDAKADILADQSRRVRAQADALARRAADTSGRQELRRRAADLDRDPFAPMEGSKRRVASGSGTALGSNSINGRNNQGVATETPAPGGPAAGSTGFTSPPSSPTTTTTNSTEKAARAAVGPAPRAARHRRADATSGASRRRRRRRGVATGARARGGRLRARADWLDAQSRRCAPGAHEVTGRGGPGYTATECGGRASGRR